jgi:putative FmdB family regulatory protein
MPIYEYECQACGHRFEEWQKMSDEPIKVCPKCKKRKVEKLISHTSFQLKGGGWYGDLYASQKPTSSSESSGGKPESASQGKPESASQGKSESASQGKSESASGKSESKSESTSGGSSSASSEGKGTGKKGASKAAA